MTYSRADLHNTSQLVLRHAETITSSRLLIVNYPADPLGLLLRQHVPLAAQTWFTFDYPTHQYARTLYGIAAPELQFGPYYSVPGVRHDGALVFLPQSRSMAEFVLAMVADALAPNSQVLLVGTTDGGIRSSRRVLEQRIGPVQTSVVGRHCVLYTAIFSQVAHAQPASLDDWTTTYTIDLHGQPLQIISLPGVFSHGRLDEGTQLLLQHLALSHNAQVLDFGCGSGLLGAAIQRLWPNSRVDFVDSNALAVEATRRTMQANDLLARRIAPSNVFSSVTERYTHIVSNPPFHIGKDTDYRVVEAFLRGAKQHLLPGGTLTIVANYFLKYQPWLEQHVGPCVVVAENKRYRVYQSRNEER